MLAREQFGNRINKVLTCPNGAAKSKANQPLLLDTILPGVLPLLTVLGVWGFLRKNRSYFLVAIQVTVISLVLGAAGLII